MGDEIQFDLERKASNAFRVRITNTSARPIFLAYLPSRGDRETVEYFPCMIEQWDQQLGEWVMYNGGGHYAPGLHPIVPNESILYDFESPYEGEYRLRFSYGVDERAVKLLKEALGNLTQEESEALLEDDYEVFSPTMAITKPTTS